MSRLRWERQSIGYGQYEYTLYDSNGNVVATCAKGGNKWYPWTWYMKDGSKLHGDVTTLGDAKEHVENIYLKALR